MKQTELAEYRSVMATSSSHGDYNWIFIARRLIEHIGELEEKLDDLKDNAGTVASWLTNEHSNRSIEKQKRMGEFLWHSIEKAK